MNRLQGPRFSPDEQVEIQRSMVHERRQLILDASSYNLRALLELMLNGTKPSAEDQVGIAKAFRAVLRMDRSLSAEAKIDVEMRRRAIYGE